MQDIRNTTIYIITAAVIATAAATYHVLDKVQIEPLKDDLRRKQELANELNSKYSNLKEQMDKITVEKQQCSNQLKLTKSTSCTDLAKQLATSQANEKRLSEELRQTQQAARVATQTVDSSPTKSILASASVETPSSSTLPRGDCNNPHANTDLSNCDLSGKDFDNLSLRNSNLSGANLSNSSFKNATLTGTILRGANLDKINFYEANLSNADLTNASVSKECTFSFANFTGTNLSGLDLYEMDFKYANNLGRAIV
ncbi:MAG TPA: pentapeptide repeat-containing protein, partial [Cyclobacteriaceae bacterium]|nr:pentapeptide repeat-containing protein [Cyclobacteriaceae bacterium]